MSKFVLTDAKVFYEGRDMSGELSSVSFEFGAETPDATTFGDVTRRRLPGVMDVIANHNGYWDSVSATDSSDADLFAEIGAASGLMSFSPDGGQLGENAYSFKTMAAQYNPGASHGEVFAFSLTVNGDGPLTKGLVMENSAFTVTANGTIRQVGAIPADYTMHSVVHVVAVSGTIPTLDVTVESDPLVGFGTATLRMTHPQFTTVGADEQTLAGAISDSFWRMVMTITGTTPSFTVFGMLGIRPTHLAGEAVPYHNMLPPNADLTITTTVPTVA